MPMGSYSVDGTLDIISGGGSNDMVFFASLTNLDHYSVLIGCQATLTLIILAIPTWASSGRRRRFPLLGWEEW